MTRLRRIALSMVAVLFAVSMSLSAALSPFASLAYAEPGTASHHPEPSHAKSSHGQPVEQSRGDPCPGGGWHVQSDDTDHSLPDSHSAVKACCGLACHTVVPVEFAFVMPSTPHGRNMSFFTGTIRTPQPLRIEHPPRSTGFPAG